MSLRGNMHESSEVRPDRGMVFSAKRKRGVRPQMEEPRMCVGWGVGQHGKAQCWVFRALQVSRKAKVLETVRGSGVARGGRWSRESIWERDSICAMVVGWVRATVLPSHTILCKCVFTLL